NMADNPTNPLNPQPNPPTPASSPMPGMPVPLSVPTPGRKQRSQLGRFFGYVLFARGRDDEIVIISHSPLFYWWPVWFFGYVMALITLFFPSPPTHAAIVPEDTELVRIKRDDYKKLVKALPEGSKERAEL